MGINYGPTVTAESLFYILTDSTLTATYNGASANIFKTSGTSAWDKQAYSPVPFTAPCTIEFNKLAGVTDNGVSYAMIGWNADPTTDPSYTSIDWAAYPYRTDTYVIYNNGSPTSYGAWDSSKKFYIVYDTDGFIKHYNGSTLLASFNKGIGQTVYIDSSLYSVNSIFGGFSNLRVVKRAWTGTHYRV